MVVCPEWCKPPYQGRMPRVRPQAPVHSALGSFLRCWWCGCEVKTQRHQTPDSCARSPPRKAEKLKKRGGRELTPGLLCCMFPWYMCVCTRVCVVPMQPRHGCGSVPTAQSRQPSPGTTSRSPCPPSLHSCSRQLLSPSEIRKGPTAPVGQASTHQAVSSITGLHLPSSSSGHPLARKDVSDRFLSGPLWMGLS